MISSIFVQNDLAADLLSRVPPEGLRFLDAPSPFISGNRHGSLYPNFDSDAFTDTTGVELVLERSKDIEGVKEVVGYLHKAPADPATVDESVVEETSDDFEARVIELLEAILAKMK
jgi:hypothetical protein